MLKKLYDKSAIGFAVVWIVAYCVLLSLGDSLSVTVGVEKCLTLPIAALMALVLFAFIKKHSLLSVYGLGFKKESPRITLYYVPILLMLGVNLIHGVKANFGIAESILYVLTMLFVGFLEEVIFRGLLFNAMRRDNEKVAIAVSSVTFGIGHIINLFNGSGAELIPNLLQVVYATAAGFMFVMIYVRSDSLVVCILAHGIFNSLGAIAAEPKSFGAHILSSVILTLITGSYALYLVFINKKPTQNSDSKIGDKTE